MADIATVSPMLIPICLGCALLLATARLSPLHPGVAWLAVWFIATALYALRLLPYDDPSDLLSVVVLGATASFIAGCLLGEKVASSRITSGASPTEHIAVARAAALVGLLTGVMLLAFLAQVAGTYGLRAALISSAEVRQALSVGFASVTIKFVYPALAAAALSGLAAATASGRARTFWLLGAASASLTTYFSTGRSTILLAATAAAVAYALGRPRQPSRARILALSAGLALVAIVALLSIGELLGKTYANSEIATFDNAFSRGDVPSLLSLPYHYAATPVAALDQQLQVIPSWGRAHGCATGREFCLVASELGADVEPEPRIRPFTSAPLAWNTYTGLDLPLIDFGPALFWVVLLAIGLFAGVCWAFASAGVPTAIFVYAMLSTAIVYSTVQFNFTAPHIVGAAVVGLLALIVSTRLGGREPHDPIPSRSATAA